MSHQPFETWNLEREQLSLEQRAELDRHVESCPTCKQTRNTWDAIRHEIETAERKQAPAGFTVRFKNSLEERRKQEHRRQVMKILIILCTSIVAILIILSVHFLLTTSPAQWIGSAIQTVTRVPVNLREIFYIVTFWFSRIPLWAVIAASVIPLLWLMVLIITGAMTYSRFHHEGETIR